MMPTASHRILIDFFENDLPFTPTPGQVEQFERDLALVSPYLMKAALKEAAAGTAFQQGAFAEKRAAIFRIYYRKVAEHSQLFPIFHTFETAFRSIVAVKLETLYGMADWWAPIVARLRAGGEARTIGTINNVNISRDAAHRIGHIIIAIEGENLGRGRLVGINDGYAFAELCDLTHICDLIVEHWSIFAPLYSGAPRVVTRTEFSAKFRKVRDARNAVYHHKSVAQMAGVVSAAEELLERLHCSLQFSYQKISEASLTAPAFSVAQVGQHNLW